MDHQFSTERSSKSLSVEQISKLEKSKSNLKKFPVVQWLRLHALNAGGMGLIPGLGTILVAQLVRNTPANAEDQGSIPGLGRSPGGGDGNPPQYSCLGNPMDRRAWRGTVYGITKRWT